MFFGVDNSWTLLFLLPPWEVWNALVNIVAHPQTSLDIEGAGLFLFLISQAAFTYVIMKHYIPSRAEELELEHSWYWKGGVVAQLLVTQLSWLPLISGSAVLYIVMMSLGVSLLFPSTSGMPSDTHLADLISFFFADRGLFFVVFFLSARFWMAPIIIIIERQSLLKGLQKSWQLSKGHYWQLLVIGTLTIILTGVVASTLPLLLLWLGSIHLLPMVYPFGLATQSLSSLASLAILPAIVAIFSSFYSFCRRRDRV